jgi:hypothetical protein
MAATAAPAESVTVGDLVVTRIEEMVRAVPIERLIPDAHGSTFRGGIRPVG